MIYFTSDTHFWHKNVITYCDRPWSTVENMNAGLIEEWNLTVDHDDEVWILGDFAFCGPTKVKEITKQLNGKKYLVKGNHDHGIKYHRTDLGFEAIVDCHLMKISGEEVVMSHYPFVGQEHDERKEFPVARYEDHGQWLLHGHVHKNWLQKGKMINVGVDMWNYRPISITLIEKIIKEPPTLTQVLQKVLT